MRNQTSVERQLPADTDVMKTALLCLALATTTFNRLVSAECIIPPPPCEALARAAIVVVVDVIEVADPWEANSFRPIPQVVKLKVVEIFRGVSREQREITGSISNNAESVFLEAGRRYLLYAVQNNDGTWGTSCSRTKLANVASEELSQLRKCQR